VYQRPSNDNTLGLLEISFESRPIILFSNFNTEGWLFSFSSRIVNIWNSLPDTVVNADTINTFKSRLDKHWVNQDVVYNFYAELLTGTGGALN